MIEKENLDYAVSGLMSRVKPWIPYGKFLFFISPFLFLVHFYFYLAWNGLEHLFLSYVSLLPIEYLAQVVFVSFILLFLALVSLQGVVVILVSIVDPMKKTPLREVGVWVWLLLLVIVLSPNFVHTHLNSSFDKFYFYTLLYYVIIYGSVCFLLKLQIKEAIYLLILSIFVFAIFTGNTPLTAGILKFNPEQVYFVNLAAGTYVFAAVNERAPVFKEGSVFNQKSKKLYPYLLAPGLFCCIFSFGGIQQLGLGGYEITNAKIISKEYCKNISIVGIQCNEKTREASFWVFLNLGDSLLVSSTQKSKEHMQIPLDQIVLGAPGAFS